MANLKFGRTPPQLKPADSQVIFQSLEKSLIPKTAPVNGSINNQQKAINQLAAAHG
jgi:hypothetical protein